MKKFLAAFGLAAGIAVLASDAWAVNPDTMLLRVTPNVNRSVNIDLAVYDFGAQNLAATDIASGSATVTNDGNFVSTWSLQIDSTGSGWTAGAAAALDTYHINAAFAAAGPVTFEDANDTLLEATEVISDGTVFNGGQTGVGVNPGSTHGLWFQLDMPTATSVSGQQEFTVTLEVQ